MADATKRLATDSTLSSKLTTIDTDLKDSTNGLGGINTKLTSVNSTLNNTTTGIPGINTKLTTIDTDLKDSTNGLGGINTKLTSVNSTLNTKLTSIDNDLKANGPVDSALKAIGTAINNLPNATQEAADNANAAATRVENVLSTLDQKVLTVKNDLPNNTDLDDIIDNGIWVLVPDRTYENIPHPFYPPCQLVVTKLLPTYATQILIDCMYGKTQIRRYSNSKWSDWKVADNNVTLLPMESDLNDVTSINKYLLASNYSYSHLPGNAIMPALLEVDTYAGSTIVIQRVTEYNSGKVYSRRQQNSAWGAWANVENTEFNKIIKYNFKTGIEYSASGYYSGGQLVESDTLRSIIFPMPTIMYLGCYNILVTHPIEILNADKDFVKYAEQYDVTYNVRDYGSPLNKLIRFYEMDQQYPYINVIYDKSKNPPYYGTQYRCPCIFAANDDMELVYKTADGDGCNIQQKTFIDKLEPGVFDISGNAGDTNFHTEAMLFKKGTIIDSSNTGLFFRYCATGHNTYYFTDSRQHYVVKEDGIGYIQLYPRKGYWKWPVWEPDIDAEGYKQFLRIIPPEDIINNAWKGKTWWCFGTSISDIGPYDNDGHNSHSGKYPLCVEALSGLKRINGAIGSGGFTKYMAQNRYVTGNVLQTPYDCDLATIEILPNDNFRDDAILGDIGDFSTDTLCGALSICLNYLTSRTRARVVVIFVNWRIYGFDDPNDFSYTIPVLAQNQIKYRNAVDKLKKICEIFGIPYIDANSGALEWGKRIGEPVGSDGTDGGITYRDHVHPSYLGGEIFGRYIWDHIKVIRPFESDIVKDTWAYTTPIILNGSARNPDNLNVITTDYIAVSPERTVYCKINKEAGDNNFYIFGYALYDVNKEEILYVDYAPDLVMPTARVTAENTAYIKFIVAKKDKDLNNVPIRVSDFNQDDIVIGISAD